jgi:hypothetical protein
VEADYLPLWGRRAPLPLVRFHMETTIGGQEMPRRAYEGVRRRRALIQSKAMPPAMITTTAMLR